MNKPLIMFFTVCISVLGFTQTTQDISTKYKRFEFSLSLNGLPVNQKKSTIDFLYADGQATSKIAIDTVKTSYKLQNQYFNASIGIGLSFYVFKNFNLSLNAKPHVNSFLSNKSKDGKVYGFQLDLMGNYQKQIKEKLFVTAGLGIARINGGYGITSGGPAKKEFLLVNGNELYDKDIGFHIIDKSWAARFELGLKFKITKQLNAFSNIGYQYIVNRTSRLNIAGAKKDGAVKWNSKTYDDSDLFLNVNDQRISNTTINRLPFDFGGVTCQFGFSVKL
jgi:hypothetical protein